MLRRLLVLPFLLLVSLEVNASQPCDGGSEKEAADSCLNKGAQGVLKGSCTVGSDGSLSYECVFKDGKTVRYSHKKHMQDAKQLKKLSH